MTRRNRRPSASELRKRRLDRIGAAIIAACVLGMGGGLYGAAKLDAANGITVSQSLANWGFGRADPDKPTRRFAREFRDAIGYEAPAREARLIGRCGGRLMAGMEESSFPAGCDWIEPIRESEVTSAL